MDVKAIHDKRFVDVRSGKSMPYALNLLHKVNIFARMELQIDYFEVCVSHFFSLL